MHRSSQAFARRDGETFEVACEGYAGVEVLRNRFFYELGERKLGFNWTNQANMLLAVERNIDDRRPSVCGERRLCTQRA